MTRCVVVISCVLAAAACSRGGDEPPPASMNETAERYVKLVLAMGQHDPAYVDSYYGPPEWKAEVEQRKAPLADIDAEAARLIAALGEANDADELVRLRHVYLRRQLESLRSRVRMLSGEKLSFDEESQA